ncbi:cyclic nucleotide-binding domain-containing protein, partial [Phenylobacterium sp.]
MHVQPSFPPNASVLQDQYKDFLAPADAPAESAKDPLGATGVRKTYARNAEIFGEGEPATYIYRVMKGVVRTYRILADGRRQIAEFFLPGDVFGLQALGDHAASAEAVTDCEVLAI